ncbi:MAG: zinc finger domain-containing protein [Collinsella sp.]
MAIEAAKGECCDRCWNYRTTVGEYNGHAHICKRCADAL